MIIQRSVSFSSIRRFLLRASSVSAGSSGWNSPKPAATSRLAGTPFSIRNFTTEVERADDKLPIVAVAAGAGQRPVVGVAVDAQHPVDLRRDLLLQFDDGVGELLHLDLAGIVDLFGADRETALPTGRRSGRRRCGCSRGRKGFRAAVRRSRSGSGSVPARAAPARRSGGGRDRRSWCWSSRSRVSDTFSASSSAPICLRSAAICWLRSSTWLSACWLIWRWLSSSPVSAPMRAGWPAHRRRRLAPATARAGSFPPPTPTATPADWRANPRRPGSFDFSSASSCVSSLICELRRLSTSSLPEISRLSRNCASTKTESRNMIARSSVDSASTKPGQ